MKEALQRAYGEFERSIFDLKCFCYRSKTLKRAALVVKGDNCNIWGR